MKNLKKVLALVMAFAMAFTMMASAGVHGSGRHCCDRSRGYPRRTEHYDR